MRELQENWNWYLEKPKAWLVITPMGFCIINRADWAYNQITRDINHTGDYNLENKKYILEKKYDELVNFRKTFSL